MPVYSLWIRSPFKGFKKPLAFIDHKPADWLEVKSFVEEAMVMLYNQTGKTETELTLECHSTSKFITKHRFYSPSYMPSKRTVEAFIKASFNPTTMKVQIHSAFFIGKLTPIIDEYRFVEKNVMVMEKPLIPHEHKHLLEAKFLLREISGLRYADYSPNTRQTYNLKEKEKTPQQNLATDILHYQNPIIKTKERARSKS